MQNSLSGGIWGDEILENVELWADELLRIILPKIFVVFWETKKRKQDIDEHVAVYIFQDLPRLRVSHCRFDVIQNLLKNPRRNIFSIFLSL